MQKVFLLPLLLLAMCGRPDKEELYRPNSTPREMNFRADPKHPDTMLNNGVPMGKNTYGPDGPSVRPKWDDKDLKPYSAGHFSSSQITKPNLS